MTSYTTTLFLGTSGFCRLVLSASRFLFPAGSCSLDLVEAMSVNIDTAVDGELQSNVGGTGTSVAITGSAQSEEKPTHRTKGRGPPSAQRSQEASASSPRLWMSTALMYDWRWVWIYIRVSNTHQKYTRTIYLCGRHAGEQEHDIGARKGERVHMH